MAQKKITAKEYAEKRGISLQAVTKAIRVKNNMPGVKKVEKFGRFYLLTLCKPNDEKL